MPGFNDPDFAAGVVLADALDSRRGELYALAAEGKALSGGFDATALPAAGFGYANAAFPRGQDSAALVTQMKQSSRAMSIRAQRRFGRSDQAPEVAEAEFRRNSIAGLAAESSQALAVEGRNSIDDDIEAIKKVTVADVNRVAKKYCPTTAPFGDHDAARIGEAVASEGRVGRRIFAPKQTKAVPLPAWAKKALAPVSVPTSTVDPIVTVLPNGLRLIIQPETISDTVGVYGRVKNRPELQVPAGKEGADQILNDLFSYGSTNLDRIAFQQALDEIGANAQAGTSFSLEVLPDGFARGVELLADNLLHPALPEAAFKAVQQRTAQAVAGQLQSPVYRSGRAFLKAIYPEKDPTLREATPDTIAALTLEDVRSYHEKVFRPDLTTIVVIGKVTPEHARAVIEKYFAAWQATGPKPETDLPPVPRNKASVTVVPDRSRVQDEVRLGQTFELKRQDDDYYALQVGLQVLSGGFYASRLIRIYGKKAVSYTLSTPTYNPARPVPCLPSPMPVIRRTWPKRGRSSSAICESCRPNRLRLPSWIKRKFCCCAPYRSVNRASMALPAGYSIARRAIYRWTNPLGRRSATRRSLLRRSKRRLRNGLRSKIWRRSSWGRSLSK